MNSIADSIERAGVNTGSSIINGRVSEKDYQRMMTQMYQQRLSQFENYVEPLMDEMEAEANSTDVLDRARDVAGNLGDKVEGIAARTESYSMDGLLPSERAAARKSRKMAVGKGKSAMITSAAASDVDRRASARAQLMQMTEQLQSTGTASISQAITQKNQRDSAYRSAKSGMMSQVGALVGAGIGFMAGPAGAAAGAGIGASIGGIAGG
jgi:beta-mannanase